MEAARATIRPDLELVSPFIMATVETFRVQYSMELTHREPYRAGDQQGVTRDFVASFGVFSHTAVVAVSFCFPENGYLEILKVMGGGTPKASVEDGIRELVNIIYGKVRKYMNTDGRLIHRSIPTLLHGKGMKVWYLTSGGTVVVPFQFPGGEFEIELTLER
jgi:CheY-specific phosphatase CheX